MRIGIVTEGASSGAADAPSVTSLLATRHLPRCTGEDKKARVGLFARGSFPRPSDARTGGEI